MPLNRAKNRIAMAAAALTFTAAAAAPASAADQINAQAKVGIAEIARWADRTEIPKPNPGPFVPLAGAPDYGTAENGFGAARSGHTHAGQDIFAAAGTPLLAVSDSVVAERGSDAGQGNYVYLYDEKHDRTFVYMHMIEPAEVQPGEQVKAGERVGGLGCTGSCWGDHLHFEIHSGRGIEGPAHDPLGELHDWKNIKRAR